MPVVILLSVIAFQVLYIFVHLAVYATLAAAFGIGGLPFKVVFAILSLTFTAATALSFRFKNWFVTRFYQFAAYWFGLVHFLFVGGVIFYVIFAIFSDSNAYVPPALIGAFTFGGLFLVHLYGTWNSHRAMTTRVKVSLHNLPPAWKERKIVFVSDIHLGNVYRSKYTAKVVRNIMAHKPDAVFIGGDIFDGGACDPDVLIEPMRGLKAPKGVYAISGNHEFYVRGFERAFEAIKATGIRLLDNEKVNIDGMDIVGVDFRATQEKNDFIAVLQKIGVDHKTPSILLKHEPKDIHVAEAAGISLGLYGHTHRGQIFPLNYITRRLYQGFDYGLKHDGAMQVYTSSGVGTWGPPVRIGTRSEIVLIEFT